jgi:orotate phosphoribosyltransferase
MSKSTIYNDLFSTKIVSSKEFIVSGEKPYNIAINKILSNPTLFDNVTLLSEYLIKNSNIAFDKICATSVSSLPYATNIAAGLEKGILYINDEGNDKTDKDNIKGITVEGGMNIDDNILLIETVIGNDFYINNIIQKITKYGGNVVGVVILFNQCEGEYVNLVRQNEKIITVLNIYDIFNHLETNNRVDLFYSERVKFYCEKVTKLNIRKLLESDNTMESDKVDNTSEKEVLQSSREPFVGQ